jgi:hypothetical protein
MSKVEAWHEWTPTITSITLVTTGPFGFGSVYEIKQPMQPSSNWTVAKCNPGKSFSWEQQSSNKKMIAGHEIRPTTNGALIILTIEMVEFSKPMEWLLRPILNAAIRKDNTSLKNILEQDK